MKPQNTFIRDTTWISILLIIFGMLTRILRNEFMTWFFLAFLCLIALVDWSERRRNGK